MAVLHNVPEQTYAAGHYDVGPLNIQNNISVLNVRATRVNWPDTGSEIAKIVIDLSMDNGQTWILGWFGMGVRGGVQLDRNGNPVLASVIRRDLPAGTNREIRMSIDIFAQLTTEIIVDND